MSKTARHKAILDLLDDGPVESQDSLQQRLERSGYDCRPGDFRSKATSTN